MTMYDSMYNPVWLCLTMYDYARLCMAIYDYAWQCRTIYDSVWLCLTMYDFVWEEERKRKREQEQFYKLFHPFAKIFKQFILFHMIQMFLKFSHFWTNLDIVYLCLPLFNWRIYAQILCLLKRYPEKFVFW